MELDTIVKFTTLVSTILGLLALFGERFSRSRARRTKELRELEVAKLRYEIEEILNRSSLNPTRYLAIERVHFGDLNAQITRQEDRRFLGVKVFYLVPLMIPALVFSAIAIAISSTEDDYAIFSTGLAVYVALVLLLTRFFFRKTDRSYTKALLALVLGLLLNAASVFTAAGFLA